MFDGSSSFKHVWFQVCRSVQMEFVKSQQRELEHDLAVLKDCNCSGALDSGIAYGLSGFSFHDSFHPIPPCFTMFHLCVFGILLAFRFRMKESNRLLQPAFEAPFCQNFGGAMC